MDAWRYRGELINSFVFCQPITVVYCGQLIYESARFLEHSVYKLSSLNVHESSLEVVVCVMKLNSAKTKYQFNFYLFIPNFLEIS